MEKYISVPHDRKKMFCFPSHEKKVNFKKTTEKKSTGKN
jgi:hypothetical protein